jgi:hypothetical protein
LFLFHGEAFLFLCGVHDDACGRRRAKRLGLSKTDISGNIKEV